ncbi:hypothetical protein B0A52_03297 [Exophiala mesophila]|uniref:Uncharacterized protein n=1 Tax=Exophiala mesophila TaxID=212818 RepID=A0A438NAZ2_EXOME|nr:hypothetical protein B0A52_03297 [Exophiala mesophila]
MASSPETDPKATSGTTTPSSHQHAHHHFHHPHVRRLTQFVLPHNGKTVHVCHSPEHVEEKKRELLEQEKGLTEFDIVLQGSPDHLEAVKQLHMHHEKRRDDLKERHGDIYSDIENVKSELDSLAAELHHLTAHAVSLDASFDRYGYSAHLRTKDEDSEVSSLHSDHPSASEKHADRSLEALKFIRRPVVRQYFHKGLLWRSSKAGEVASFELFVDLVYVGVIDIIGETAVEHPGGLALLQFIIVFSIAWKIWSDLTMVINHFEIDDIAHRLVVVFYLVCLFGFTTNIAYAFESTYTSLIAFYITNRPMIGMSIQIFLSVAIWIASIHVEWPNQLAPIFIALILDLFGGIFLVYLFRQVTTKAHLKSIARWFDFMPAINIEHRVDRSNAFTSLVFGYSILTILFQSSASFGINSFFGKGALGLIQAFTFNWIYFEIDNSNVHVHAIRRHWFSSSLWVSAHLPFIMGYILAASTLSQLVLAHDTADADEHDLGHHYEERSVGEIPVALRWFYCGGLGTALIFMSVISFTHVHKRLARSRLRKRPRLVIRLGVAIIIICLPIARSLTSLELIATTTCLVAFVLMLDLFGISCQGDRFWTGGWCDGEKKKCNYTANIKLGRRRRKELEKALIQGQKLSIADLMKRHSSMSSLESAPSRDEEWQGGHY